MLGVGDDSLYPRVDTANYQRFINERYSHKTNQIPLKSCRAAPSKSQGPYYNIILVEPMTHKVSEEAGDSGYEH